jgi:hypothetical protein
MTIGQELEANQILNGGKQLFFNKFLHFYDLTKLEIFFHYINHDFYN